MINKLLLFVIITSVGFVKCNSQQKVVAPNAIADTAYTYKNATEDGIGKFYFGREIAHVMGAGGGEWLEREERNKEENTNMAIEKIDLPTNAIIADIGAGTGAFLNKVAKSNWNITGLEPDAGARKICKDKYNIDLAPAHEIFSLKDQQYDAVTMWHVLEHVHELHEYMEEIKRVLKPNGVVLIALPNYTSEDAEHYKESWAAYDVPRHLYHFAPTAINNLVAQHQMVVEKIKPMWLDAFYIALLSENYKNGKDNLISAVLNGLKSNLVALKDSSKCSSLVYIIRHKL